MNVANLTPSEFIAALDRAGTRRTTSNGTGDVVWRIWGTGDPLVLLHGGTGSWMHWVRNIEALSQDFMLLGYPGLRRVRNPDAAAIGRADCRLAARRYRNHHRS